MTPQQNLPTPPGAALVFVAFPLQSLEDPKESMENGRANVRDEQSNYVKEI